MFIALLFVFLALAYGAMTGADLLRATAHAKASSKPKPPPGPDDTDDGSGGVWLRNAMRRGLD